MGLSLGQLQVTLAVKTDSSLKKAPGDLKKVGGATKGLIPGIRGMGAAFKSALGPISLIVAGISAVVAVAAKAIKAADAQTLAQTNLSQAMANQGNLLPGVAVELQNYASRMQEVSLFGDEAILTGQKFLATAGMTADQIKQATPAVLDFAQATGTDLNTAFQLVQKAADGQTGALSRYGIVLSDAEKKGDVLTAVTDKMAGRFGGSAKAATETFSGRVSQLWGHVGDLVEAIGSVILTVIDFGGSGTGGIQWLSEQIKAFAGFLKETAVPAIGAMRAAYLGLIASVVEGSAAMLEKVGGIVSIFNQDLGDAYFNAALEARGFAETMRETGEQIELNALITAGLAESTNQSTQAMVNQVAQAKAVASASQVASETLKTWTAQQQQWRMENALVQEQQFFWAEVSNEVATSIVSDTAAIAAGYDGVALVAQATAAMTEQAFRSQNVTMRAESEATKTKTIADLKQILATDKITTAQRVELNNQLNELVRSNEETTATTRTQLLDGSLTASAQILGQFAGKSKAAAIAQAGINTAVAATKTWAQLGFPLGIPAVAAVIASGAAQIAKIKSQKSGFRTGTPNLDFKNFGVQSDVQLHGNEAVIPRGGGHALAGEIAAALGGTMGGMSAPVTPAPSRGGGASGGGSATGTNTPLKISLDVDGKSLVGVLVPSIEDATKRGKLRIHEAAMGERSKF